MLCFWAASPVGLWEDTKRSLPPPDSHTCQVLCHSDACIPLPQKSAGWQCDPSLWCHRWRVLLPQSWQNSHLLLCAPDLAVQSYLKECNVKGKCSQYVAWNVATCIEAAIRLFNNICPALFKPINIMKQSEMGAVERFFLKGSKYLWNYLCKPVRASPRDCPQPASS